MSATTYTMKLVVDDSAVKKLEDRIGKLMGGGGSSGGSGGASGGSQSPFGQLMKLGAIAAGVAALVVAVKKITEKIVEASPALQAMLKLLDASVTLILRPFGDFVAYLLRPILIIFLTKVALPFYKMAQPIMQLLGSGIGDFLAGGANALGTIGMGILQGDWEAIENGFNWFKGIWLNFVDWIADALGFPDWLVESLNGLWDLFFNFEFAKQATDLVIKFWEMITHLKIPEFVFDLLHGFIDWFSNLDVTGWGEWVIGMIGAFIDWFIDLKIADWVIGMVFAFIEWFREFKIAEWVMNMITMFQDWFKNLRMEDWMTLFLYGFYGLLGLLGIAQTLVEPALAFFNFILWLSEQIQKAAKWFSDALSSIGLGGIFGGAGSSSGGSSTSTAKTDININIEGNGELGAGQMDELLQRLKVLMK